MDPRKYVFPQRCLPHQGMIIYSINNSIMPSLCDDDYDYDDEDQRRIKRNKRGNEVRGLVSNGTYCLFAPPSQSCRPTF